MSLIISRKKSAKRILFAWCTRTAVWKLRKFTLTLFRQKFRESSRTKLFTRLIWKFSVRVNFSFFYSEKFTSNFICFHEKTVIYMFISKNFVKLIFFLKTYNFHWKLISRKNFKARFNFSFHDVWFHEKKCYNN